MLASVPRPHTAVNGPRRLRGPLQLTVWPQFFSEFLGLKFILQPLDVRL